MVYVIVEIDKSDVGDIVTRLLGAKHKITVVDDLQTACGCHDNPKRKKIEAPSQSVTVSSTKQIPLTSIGGVISGETGETFEEEDDEMENEITLMTASSALLDLLEDPLLKVSNALDDSKPDVKNNKNRRNNGVPYHPGTLCPQLRRGGSGDGEEDIKDEYQEGVDMAIRCMVCTKIIALGTRPANYSTRKYAHARSHGFSDRFSCNICHAVFKNKRSIYSHQKTFHDTDPNFRIVDNWSEESQRELMNMVMKCFPKTNKPFPKRVLMLADDGYTPPNTQSLTDQLIHAVNQQEEAMRAIKREAE
ncbi:unnamed protein product [Auanema sp. JU1783]|nr:unnamed protein product [Auanema sp. JU1783]